jgi:Glycosyl Hydrolase Family 88.
MVCYGGWTTACWTRLLINP